MTAVSAPVPKVPRLPKAAPPDENCSNTQVRGGTFHNKLSQMKEREWTVQPQTPAMKCHAGEEKEGEKLAEASVLGRYGRVVWKIHGCPRTHSRLGTYTPSKRGR